MAKTAAELEAELAALRETYIGLQGRLSTLQQHSQQSRAPGQLQSGTIQQTIEQLKKQLEELQTKHAEINKQYTALARAEANAAEAATAAAAASAATALATAEAKAKAKATAKAQTPAPPTQIISQTPAPSAPPAEIISQSPTRPAQPTQQVPAPPVPAEITTPINNRSNEGIDDYKAQRRDYIEQQIQKLEDEIKELEATPSDEKDKNENKKGFTFHGGNPQAQMNEHIQKLEARVKQLEERVAHLEKNCCNKYTESLIDINKQKIAKLKEEIALLKAGYWLNIFGEQYHTSDIYKEGTEMPYDGVLPLNAFFRNFGLDRRYVAKDIAKDKWSREYVDDVLRIFYKYFGNGVNARKMLDAQDPETLKQDANLLCPHLKRRYETIQWDIARETTIAAPMNPSRIEGVGHFYRQVWEDLDDFLRTTNICEGKIKLSATPLKVPLSAATKVPEKLPSPATRPQRAMPEHSLPTTKGRKSIPTFEKALPKDKSPSLISKFIPFADRIALPKGPDGKWQMFPSRTPKQPTPLQIPSTLHLINYLTNKLNTNPIQYPAIHKIIVGAPIVRRTITPSGIQLQTIPPIKYPAILTGQLVNYLTNKLGQIVTKTPATTAPATTAPATTAPATTAPALTTPVEQPSTLHLINYLTNKLNTNPIQYPEIHKITVGAPLVRRTITPSGIQLQPIPRINYPAILTGQLVNYLTNQLGQIVTTIPASTTPATTAPTLTTSLEQPSTLHLVNYLTNQLNTNPIQYPEIHRIIVGEPIVYRTITPSGIQLQPIPRINYPAILTGQLVNYLTNQLGQIVTTIPASTTPATTAPTLTTSLEQPSTLHLVNYLTNQLNTNPIQYPEIHRIIVGEPIVYRTITPSGIQLQTIPSINYPAILTGQLVNYLTNQLEGYVPLAQAPILAQGQVPAVQINSEPPTQPNIEEGNEEENEEEANQTGGKMEILGTDGQWQTIENLEELSYRQIFKDVLRGELRERQNSENGYQLQLPSIYEKPYIIGDNKDQISLPTGKFATELFNNEFSLIDEIYRPLYLIEPKTLFKTKKILHINVVKMLAHSAYRFYINLYKNIRTNINENTEEELSMLDSYKQSAERCTELVKCTVVYSACKPDAKLLLFQEELLFKIHKLLPLINKYNNHEPFKNALQEELQFKFLIKHFKLYFSADTKDLNANILNEAVNPHAKIIKQDLSKIKTFLDTNPIITSESINEGQGPVNNAPARLPEGSAGTGILPLPNNGANQQQSTEHSKAVLLQKKSPSWRAVDIQPTTARVPSSVTAVAPLAPPLATPPQPLTIGFNPRRTVVELPQSSPYGNINGPARVYKEKIGKQEQPAPQIYRQMTKETKQEISEEIRKFLSNTTHGIIKGRPGFEDISATYEKIKDYLPNINTITNSDIETYITTPDKTMAIINIVAKHKKDLDKYIEERNKIMTQPSGKQTKLLKNLSETYKNYRGGNRMKTRRNKRK